MGESSRAEQVELHTIGSLLSAPENDCLNHVLHGGASSSVNNSDSTEKKSRISSKKERRQVVYRHPAWLGKQFVNHRLNIREVKSR